jgi:hypothetical protein
MRGSKVISRVPRKGEIPSKLRQEKAFLLHLSLLKSNILFHQRKKLRVKKLKRKGYL